MYYARIIINFGYLRFLIESNVNKNIFLVFGAHGNEDSEHLCGQGQRLHGRP